MCVHNTTQQLIVDVEVLREYLGIARWLVFGGSWGSTLGLAYGQAHPERCSGFLLRGIFLGRQSEIDWFMYGLRQIFPEAWQKFAGMLPEEERGDLLRGYLARLFDPDPRVHMQFARAWSEYEGTCSTLLPNPELVRTSRTRHSGWRGSRRITSRTAAFSGRTSCSENMDRLRRHPASIVHSRYDMVCPILSADELARAWPGARYTIVPDAGHSVWETAVRPTVVTELERFKTLLG